MNATLTFVRGANGKPVASRELENALSRISGLQGECFFGYPLIATPEGKLTVDAAFVSPDKGIILFDIVEGMQEGDYTDRQDDIANKIEARLKLHRELIRVRKLTVPIHTITFAPALTGIERHEVEHYPLANAETLGAVIKNFSWPDADYTTYRAALSAIETISSIRKSRVKREVKRTDSRGAKLKRLEDAISTLDHRQNRAVVETVDGVQRIRGLAGSGKTIVLALKAAYLHAQNPEWRIAVTFHTRSLKGQFKRLINNFCIEQTGEEPAWNNIRVINAWGAPGTEDREGIYYEFCRRHDVEFLDFRAAKGKFGSGKAFSEACREALDHVSDPLELYDVILVDEAQDFSPSFLQLCYAILREPKRLVYAYDELQNLSGESLPSPEHIFGSRPNGKPLVALGGDPIHDVILQKCYRNSRPVLVTAHALGFGIYREPHNEHTGLIQMFDHPRLWEEIGYGIKEGRLAEGERVVLYRSDETSPRFLEDHSPIGDIVQFIEFEDEQAQSNWLVNAIKENLNEDELRHDDIIVINPDPLTTREKTGPIRRRLLELGIQCHLTGVDTDSDVFFKTETSSVTFTGIYRAKGNEAGMVYLINAQDCHSRGLNLASLRNRLFTAITRSKAWVRVIGWGAGMRVLKGEYDRLKAKAFEIDFVYPTKDQLKKLRIVHRDLSPSERKRLEQRTRSLTDLVRDLESGIIHIEDLAPETKQKLKRYLFEEED